MGGKIILDTNLYEKILYKHLTKILQVLNDFLKRYT